MDSLSFGSDSYIELSWDNELLKNNTMSAVLMDSFGGGVFNNDLHSVNTAKVDNPALTTLKLKINLQEVSNVKVNNAELTL